MDNRANVAIMAYTTEVVSIVRKRKSLSMPTGKMTKANSNDIFPINFSIDKLRADGSTRMFRAKMNTALDMIIPVQVVILMKLARFNLLPNPTTHPTDTFKLSLLIVTFFSCS